MRLRGTALLEEYKAQRDLWCMKKFNKHERDLTLDEMKQLDQELPGWAEVYTRNNDLVEVSMGGTRVRNYKTKKEFKIYYPTYNGKLWYPIASIISIPGKRAYVQSVHRLVAEAFVTNPDPWKKQEANHIDGNKQNNAWYNLEWVTDSENKQHAVRMRLMVNPKGEDHPMAKCTNEQIRQVCELLQNRPDMTYKEIEEITGVPDYITTEIKCRTNWTSISKDYEFPDSDHHYSSCSFEQREKVRQLLCDRPDLTYDKIAEMTGVTSSIVAQIKRKTNWKKESVRYEFPDRDTVLQGEEITNSRYTNEQVEHVCQLLHDRPDLTYKQIEKETGVGWFEVGSIYRGKNWKHISKDYMPFPPRNARAKGEISGKSKYTDEQVEHVCRLLQDKPDITFEDISKATNVSIQSISKIYHGTTRQYISKKYNMQAR